MSYDPKDTVAAKRPKGPQKATDQIMSPFNILKRRDWQVAEREATAESIYLGRREFIAKVGLHGGLALGGSGILASLQEVGKPEEPIPGLPTPSATASLYPAARNQTYKLKPGQIMTSERTAATYNNFYEFSTKKEEVCRLVDRFQTRPWEVEVAGLVEKPGRFSLDDLVRKMTLEERIYRFRCVEAWSMVVPWTGFPLTQLLGLVKPKSKAKYLKFWTVRKPETMPGISKYASWGYKFPYYEGLSLAEARNELSFLVTGIYGHELTKQHGAPIRLAVPWKYGFKSIKSIVKIEFVEKKPNTFWNDLYPKEYGFLANVDPTTPHPRWSQATERVLGKTERIITLPYNGYGKQVGGLYLPTFKKKRTPATKK